MKVKRVYTRLLTLPKRARGAGSFLLRIPGGDPKDYLHDQRRGIVAHDVTESNEKSRLFSDSGRGHQAALPSPAECRQEVAHRPGMARGAAPIRHPLARTHRAGTGGLKSKPSHEGETRLHKIIDTTFNLQSSLVARRLLIPCFDRMTRHSENSPHRATQGGSLLRVHHCRIGQGRLPAD
jgi:hypothetical protein